MKLLFTAIYQIEKLQWIDSHSVSASIWPSSIRLNGVFAYDYTISCRDNRFGMLFASVTHTREKVLGKEVKRSLSKERLMRSAIRHRSVMTAQCPLRALVWERSRRDTGGFYVHKCAYYSHNFWTYSRQSGNLWVISPSSPARGRPVPNRRWTNKALTYTIR